MVLKIIIKKSILYKYFDIIYYYIEDKYLIFDTKRKYTHIIKLFNKKFILKKNFINTENKHIKYIYSIKSLYKIKISYYFIILDNKFNIIKFNNLDIKDKITLIEEYKSLVLIRINRRNYFYYDKKFYKKINFKGIEDHRKFNKLIEYNKYIKLIADDNSFLYDLNFKLIVLKNVPNWKIKNIIDFPLFIKVILDNNDELYFNIKNYNNIKFKSIKNKDITLIIQYKFFLKIILKNDKIYFYNIKNLNWIKFKNIKENNNIRNIRDFSNCIEITLKNIIYFYDKNFKIINFDGLFGESVPIFNEIDNFIIIKSRYLNIMFYDSNNFQLVKFEELPDNYFYNLTRYHNIIKLYSCKGKENNIYYDFKDKKILEFKNLGKKLITKFFEFKNHIKIGVDIKEYYLYKKKKLELIKFELIPQKLLPDLKEIKNNLVSFYENEWYIYRSKDLKLLKMDGEKSILKIFIFENFLSVKLNTQGIIGILYTKDLYRIKKFIN